LYEDNGFYGDSLPETLSTALSMLNKNGKQITCMSYSPNGGWIILYDENSYVQNNIPHSLTQKIDNLAYRDQTIKHAAFSENGWVVLYSVAGYSYSGIPEAVSQQIDKLYKENHVLNKVFFLGKHWVIVYDSYKYISDF
jgi:hydroxymethylpyrimidine pyrophosphatase-like HAD family hydrolase